MICITRKITQPANDMVFSVGMETDFVVWVVETDVVNCGESELT